MYQFKRIYRYENLANIPSTELFEFLCRHCLSNGQSLIDHGDIIYLDNCAYSFPIAAELNSYQSINNGYYTNKMLETLSEYNVTVEYELIGRVDDFETCDCQNSRNYIFEFLNYLIPFKCYDCGKHAPTYRFVITQDILNQFNSNAHRVHHLYSLYMSDYLDVISTSKSIFRINSPLYIEIYELLNEISNINGFNIYLLYESLTYEKFNNKCLKCSEELVECDFVHNVKTHVKCDSCKIVYDLATFNFEE